jgi:hypothetical protein
MLTAWTTPEDIRREIKSCWTAFLSAPLEGTTLFPFSPRFRRPTPRDLSERFEEVRLWIRTLEENSRSKLGFGYDIQSETINSRALGSNSIPLGITIATESDALRVIDMEKESEQFRLIADRTIREFPPLQSWLARRPLEALRHADDWDRILAILAWFNDHPRPALYVRQLDISGIDTKFIETHKGLLSELLDHVLPPETLDPSGIGPKNFEERYGLVAKPSLVRFRLLDERLYVQGLSDITIPARDFGCLATTVTKGIKRVFITENDVNGLVFPPLPESLVVFGLGYALERLAAALWMRGKAMYYWGDIDTHGFAMLDRLRSDFSHAQSLLMDRETLMAHRNLWVIEADQSKARLTRLNPAEQSLLQELQQNGLGDRIRLEQERIPFSWLQPAIQRLAG